MECQLCGQEPKPKIFQLNVGCGSDPLDQRFLVPMWVCGCSERQYIEVAKDFMMKNGAAFKLFEDHTHAL